MITVNKFSKAWIFFDIILINLVLAFLLYYIVLRPTYEEEKLVAQVVITPTPVVIVKTPIPVSTATPQPRATITPTPVPTPTPTEQAIVAGDTSPVRTVSYVSMTGEGQTTNTGWTDITGSNFYLNRSDYSSNLEVYFESNFKLLNGNGKAFVRLFDVTNGREVDRSVLETSSQDFVLLTGGPLSIWEGNNLYKVQIKTLTADTVVYKSGRIKIINETNINE